MTTLVTREVARLMLAPILMVALAILVKGYADVGDGFAAGVVASLGLLLQYVALGVEEAERRQPLRGVPNQARARHRIAQAGAIGALRRGEPVFTHWPPPGAEVATVGTLELITAVAFDLGVFLLVIGAVVGTVRALALVQPDDDGEEEDGR